MDTYIDFGMKVYTYTSLVSIFYINMYVWISFAAVTQRISVKQFYWHMRVLRTFI